MKKKKTYEISVIDKTYSNTVSDETKFYTSDTALELGFELKETGYSFESAEIVLLNIDDLSLVTRTVTKNSDGFTYDLDDDITAHYGEWRGQLILKQAGEIYVSSKVKFRIENDLSNELPPQLSDVQSWVSLKRYADSLAEELKQAVLSVKGIEDTFNENESVRQSQELERLEAENQRNLTSVDEFAKLQDAIGGRNLLQKTSSEWKNLTMNEGVWFTVFGYDENYQVEVGQTYTFSIIVDKINPDDNVPINLHIGLGDTRGSYIYDILSLRQNDIPMGVKVSSTYTITENDVANGRIWFAYRLRNERIATAIKYKEVKLEKGTQATPHTKAPEDYTAVSKDDYYNHIKLMSDFKNNQFNQLRKAVIALGVRFNV